MMRNATTGFCFAILILLCGNGPLYSADQNFADHESADQIRLLVVNQVDHTLRVVAPDSGKQISSVSVGVDGHEVAASPNGELAYVPIYSNVALGNPGTNGRTIDVVNIASGKIAYTIAIWANPRPHKAVFGSDGMLYVTAELQNAIYVVNPSTREVVGSIPTGEPQSHMIAIHGDRGYTANVSSGTVSVLDLKQRKKIAEIHAADDIQRISLSPDGRRAFTHAKDNRVIVIDTDKNQVIASIPTSGMPYSSAVTNDGKFLVVLMPVEPKPAVIDIATNKVVREVRREIERIPKTVSRRHRGAGVARASG